MRLRGVEEMANHLLRVRDAPPVGKNWASKFVKRRPELRTRFSRKYDYQRAKCEDAKLIGEWFALVRNTKAKYGILDDDTYNFDETGFMMGVIFAGMVVTTSDGRSRAKLAQPGNWEWSTVIQAVSALGWAIPPFIILAAQHHLANWYQECDLPANWRIATTDNGWTTNEVGLDWIKHFDHHTAPCTKGPYRLLILDGHESHHSTEFELYCKEHNIITLCMPSHSSHLLQPLDVGCFGPLKQAYGRQIEDLMRTHITHITKLEFLCAFREAFFSSMTEKNIQGGFAGAGLVPYDPRRVLSKLDVQLRTPTPPVTLPGTPQAWVPKTPQNAREATSQSKHIKNRISAHQNSSPTSMLAAVDQLEKGTTVIMHQVALLRAEVSTLRKANEALRVQIFTRESWGVLRRHDGTILKGIQYRIRDKRNVGRRVKVSWIYSYGAELEHSNDKYFLCADCHTKKRYTSQLFAAESTTAAIQHLLEFHKIKRPSNSTTGDDDIDATNAAEVFQLIMPFNEDEYKQKLIDWAIKLRLSYREVTDESTTDLLTYGKPPLARLLPTHHSTLSRWVKDSMAARLPFIIELVQSALSRINLSIDGWRAHNRREYIAVCGHFVDGQGHPRTLLLGFPRRYGGHTGDDLAALVKPVILQYGIGEKLGSFVMDNADDNDKCLEVLQRSFSSIDPEADRIRCIGHIINLVVKALLYGEGVSAWEKNLIEASEEQRVALWTSKASLASCIISLSTLIETTHALRARMRVAKTSDGMLFVGVLLSDGGIRWNATFYMIERALKCRPAIDLYQAQWKPPDRNDKHKNDFLTEADWHELELFYRLLQPFERLTKRLQCRADGEGNEGGQGSVWQVLYAMDFLLTKLENVKDEIHAMDADNEDELPPYYSAGVLAAWSKINTYYELTDRLPIRILQGEVVEARGWIRTAQKELTAYYDRFAAVTVAADHVDQAETSPCSSPTLDDEFDAWGHTTDRPHRGKRRKMETEWEVWIKQVPSKDDMNIKNPLAWWVDRRHIWPILSKLALNIFSTPAMSAEPERVFSDGGELITDKRNGLGDDTVEAEMVQKSWITSKILHGIATPRGLYKLPD
ncbi:LOW QUALITY PROTEIN: transposase-like protein [Purpureocillium lavendulum]|uniref:Transposase-like protein n=1 Tax=Purpureocillium lavendulum TaxID=1247861 RepID=A0AB34FFZ9_9HYPO|nr:LOW QUALITY PROTEIN: transposase-like protein [Purpureocillium lavendulum]